MADFPSQSGRTTVSESGSTPVTPVLSQLEPSSEFTEYKVISVPSKLDISEMLTTLSPIDHDQGISDLEVQSVMCQGMEKSHSCFHLKELSESENFFVR